MKTNLIASIFICILFWGCQKEDDTTTYVDGNNYSIGGDTSHLHYSYIDNYNSGNSSELASTLHFSNPHPGPNLPGWTDATVIYSIKIPNLKKGDVISATAIAEISYSFINNNYGIWLYGILMLGNNQSDIPTSSNIIKISAANGHNFTHDMGHYIAIHLGDYECTQDLGDRYVNYILDAAVNDQHAPLNDDLTVEQDYGRLAVTVYRK